MHNDRDTIFAPGNLFARDDTFFGVCEAIGQDFGFSPNWLRIGLALALFVNPLAAIATYAGAGLVVALIHWAVPKPLAAKSAASTAPLQGENDAEATRLAA